MKASRQAMQSPTRRARTTTSDATPEPAPSARSGGRTLAAPWAGHVLQPKLRISQPGDALELEADRIADQVMRMPGPAPAGPGIGPTPIREALQHKTQDPQSAGATVRGLDSVAATLHRSGQALDPATRAFFEPRFGVDFSAVRIHTDSQAAASARAIQARAYTVGNDVVFDTGQYAPHHDSGKRLLAHELTHVLQQSQGAGTRDPHAGSSGRSAPMQILRKPTTIDFPVIGGGGSYWDSSIVRFTPSGYVLPNRVDNTIFSLSSSDFPEGSYGDVSISAGMKAVVRIAMKIYIWGDNWIFEDKLNQEFRVDWSVSAAPDGKLTIDPNPAIMTTRSTPAWAKASLASINPITPGTDYVRVNPIVSTAGGSGSISPVGVGVSTNVPGQFVTAPFTLRINVKDIAPPKVTLDSQRTYTVLFPPPRSRVGQDKVSSAQEQGLIRWFQTLTGPTREQIAEGKIPVMLVGRASTTGGPSGNRELSNRRMENVKRILRQFLGSKVVFEDRAAGEYEAQTPDEMESQDERTVVVSVLEQHFEGTGAPAGSAP
jgi:hypothetical protein